MTGSASHIDVGAGKRERRVVVIESRTRPGVCGMTQGTVLRKTRGDVVRIVRASKIRLVTGDAGG